MKIPFYWKEPSTDQCQSRGNLLMNFQRHCSIRTSLKIRQKGHWSTRVSPEIRMDQCCFGTTRNELPSRISDELTAYPPSLPGLMRITQLVWGRLCCTRGPCAVSQKCLKGSKEHEQDNRQSAEGNNRVRKKGSFRKGVFSQKSIF